MVATVWGRGKPLLDFILNPRGRFTRFIFKPCLKPEFKRSADHLKGDVKMGERSSCHWCKHVSTATNFNTLAADVAWFKHQRNLRLINFQR